MKHDKTVARKRFRGRQNGYDDNDSENNKRQRKHKRWHYIERDFRCRHCRQMVLLTSVMGTLHRNHCNHCLWSLHVDTKPGNRQSDCHGRMEPVGLTFQQQKPDKYGNERLGDVTLVHLCRNCDTVSINRIAADDNDGLILEIFENALSLDGSTKDRIRQSGIRLMQPEDRKNLHAALFGKQPD